MSDDKTLEAEFVLREHHNRQRLINAVRNPVRFGWLGGGGGFIPPSLVIAAYTFFPDNVTALCVCVCVAFVVAGFNSEIGTRMVDRRINALLKLINLEEKQAADTRA